MADRAVAATDGDMVYDSLMLKNGQGLVEKFESDCAAVTATLKRDFGEAIGEVPLLDFWCGSWFGRWSRFCHVVEQDTSSCSREKIVESVVAGMKPLIDFIVGSSLPGRLAEGHIYLT